MEALTAAADKAAAELAKAKKSRDDLAEELKKAEAAVCCVCVCVCLCVCACVFTLPRSSRRRRLRCAE